jgi:serine/threonine protein kinase
MLLESMQLGRYKLLKRIGGGGMGDVYLAEDPQIGHRVAIKVIKTEATLDLDTIVVENFQEEARAIAQLDHPHIMPLLSYGEEQVHGDTVAYIVMPYRKEGNLIQWMRQHPQPDAITPTERGRLIQQAASALNYAHDRNIIHRDVKPSNFLVRENPDSPRQPDLLLSDFGLAKLMNATSSASQNVRGTPAYMAPEQWSGTAAAASDQYSLAVMAYELLTGRTPFQGNPLQMMNKHLNEEPPLPGSFNPALPDGADKVLLCALRKKPSERYPSVLSFANNLLNALSGLEYIISEPNIEIDGEIETKANTRLQAPPADADEQTVLSNREQEKLTSTVRVSYTGSGQSSTLEIDDTEHAEGEGASGIVQPISVTSLRPRPLRRKILFAVLAAVIVLSLVSSSVTLALLTHNGAGNLARTNTQSAVSNNNSSTGTHVTAHSTSGATVQPTAHQKQKTPTSGAATSTPVGSTPTQQPTSNPPTQPSPSPTSQPTPQPTSQPTPSPTPQPMYCLNVSTQYLALSGTQGQSYSNEPYFTITNCGNVAEAWSAYQNSQGNWIQVSQPSGTLNPGTSQSEGARASLSGLSAGNYTGYLYFDVNSTNKATITISLTVQPPPPCLQSNATSLAFYGTQGQSYSNTVYITIANCSSVAETWTDQQYTTDGNTWICANQHSGTLNPGYQQSIAVDACLAGLGPGTYTGFLYYYVGSTKEVTISVTLTVS